MPLPTGVYQEYDGLIPNMRREGYTLQAIGDRIGVCRERVRQILEEFYPDAKPILLNETQASHLLGFPLKAMRRKGLVKPIKRCHFYYYYDRDQLETAMLAYYHPCTFCGEPTAWWRKYCPKCTQEVARYAYPFMTEEEKAKFHVIVNNWRKRNPERARLIQQRANKKYLGKNLVGNKPKDGGMANDL